MCSFGFFPHLVSFTNFCNFVHYAAKRSQSANKPTSQASGGFNDPALGAGPSGERSLVVAATFHAEDRPRIDIEGEHFLLNIITH